MTALDVQPGHHPPPRGGAGLATDAGQTGLDLTDQGPVAEDLHVPERLIAAPAAGVFRAAAPDVVTTEGEIVYAGQQVGTVEVTGGAVPVTSPHTGFLMGLLALPGERVRTDQPLAWVRVVQ